jgi:3-dehydroquinate dehydratase / shikimate dehydrogenase
MTAAVTLRTERLVLRPWRESDRAPFAAMNADPKVMEHFPAVRTREESDSLMDRIVARMDQEGYGLWAVEVPGVAEFIGFIGLGPADAVLGRPATEIGWRLAAEHWGRGYATEGARASLAHAFDGLGLDEVVSFTTAANERSRHVMEKIGMARRPEDDFDHPGVPPAWPGRRHVLYRITRAQWRALTRPARHADPPAGGTPPRASAPTRRPTRGARSAS